MSLVQEYFNYYKKFNVKYNKIALLMQVGSFYESYGVDNSPIKIGNTAELANLLNIQLTRKSKKILENSQENPLMMGFPCIVIDKYIPVLLDNNYTVIIIEQTSSPPNPKREVTKILSPGVNIDSKDDTNNIISIFIEITNNIYSLGLSGIDFSIGKCTVYESHYKEVDVDYMFDETSKFIKSLNPKEIIVNLKSTNFNKEYICKILELDNIVTHIYIDEINNIYFNNSFQNNFYRKIFQPGLLSCIEYLDLERKGHASISYIKLLEFAYEHNENIIKNIQKPKVIENEKNLLLVNNTIQQLNLDDKQGIPSVFSIVNNTSTTMGKRLLKHRLLNPIVDHTELNKRYKLIKKMIKHYNLYEPHLNSILDLERLHRKIQLNLLVPTDILNIKNAYDKVLEIDKLSSKIPELKLDKQINIKVHELLSRLDNVFNYEILYTRTNLTMYNESFINKNINVILDEIQENILKIKIRLEEISKKLSNSIEKGKDDLIKIEKNDKDGIFLVTTPIRGKSLQMQYNEYSFKINKNNTRISSFEIDKLSNQWILYNEKLKFVLEETYKKILDDINIKYSSIFDSIVNYIAEVDFTKSGAKTSIKNNYTQPVIKKCKNSYIKVKSIRHPLIESINKEIKYVPNDIELGKGENGMILYSVNGLGKSSLLKSVGVNVILAQSGLFVAAKRFEYSPFQYIISRIQGSDNILKSQSSFIVEMSELRVILNKSNTRTLVLGDELCRGTEHTSAVSIVASAVKELSDRGSLFIFASHLHELTRIPQIQELKNIGIYNLAVVYDEKTGILKYNRKLEKGSGLNMYGLEVAKSMDLKPEFIKNALSIRKFILNSKNEIFTPKHSKYNSNKFVDSCEICKSHQQPLDTHHINFQCNADKNGMIDHFHKNDKHNLVVLCKDCHNKVHNNQIIIEGYSQTSTGIKLIYEII